MSLSDLARHPIGKKPSTQAGLRRAVFRAARYLEEYLDSPPKVEDLARHAGLSEFHFHRVFKAVVGESVASHSLRLRVEKAATLLRFSAWQVQEIAAMCGFASQVSFCRSFRRFYGVTPGDFRGSENARPFLRTPARSGETSIRSRSRASPLAVQIRPWPELTAIGVRHYGPIEEVRRPWSEVLDWLAGNQSDFTACRFLGLWFDDYRVNHDVDTPYRYEALVIMPEGYEAPPPEPLLTRRIPAGLVAEVQARGTTRILDRLWRTFAYEWLPASGYQPRLRFMIDEYPVSLMQSSLLGQAAAGLFGISMKLCLPVQRGDVNMFGDGSLL